MHTLGPLAALLCSLQSASTATIPAFDNKPTSTGVIVELSLLHTTTVDDHKMNERAWVLVGDNKTMADLLDSIIRVEFEPLADNCPLRTSDILPFDPTTHPPLDLIQWYHTPSSAPLALGVHHSFATQYSPLLHCVNSTITTALTSFDALPSTSKVDTGGLLGIGVGAFIGFMVVLVLVSAYAILCFIIPCYKRIMMPVRDTQIPLSDLSMNGNGREDRGEEGQTRSAPSTSNSRPRSVSQPVPSSSPNHSGPSDQRGLTMAPSSDAVSSPGETSDNYRSQGSTITIFPAFQVNDKWGPIVLTPPSSPL